MDMHQESITAVLKYPITKSCTIAMPAGATVISAKEQHDHMVIYVIADVKSPKVARKFVAYGTGDPIHRTNLKFIDTVTLRGGAIVEHVFEDLSSAPQNH